MVCAILYFGGEMVNTAFTLGGHFRKSWVPPDTSGASKENLVYNWSSLSFPFFSSPSLPLSTPCCWGIKPRVFQRLVSTLPLSYTASPRTLSKKDFISALKNKKVGKPEALSPQECPRARGLLQGSRA
jgi:hypothetical protein